MTGTITNYQTVAQLIHAYDGFCFVDFATSAPSAPYTTIDMHPDNEQAGIEAIYYSPHKFLVGPGSGGILILKNTLTRMLHPDNPGGGTVAWSTPWATFRYHEERHVIEDGGSPGSVAVRESMGTIY